jgi:hypothetical protein
MKGRYWDIVWMRSASKDFKAAQRTTSTFHLRFISRFTKESSECVSGMAAPKIQPRFTQLSHSEPKHDPPVPLSEISTDLSAEGSGKMGKVQLFTTELHDKHLGTIPVGTILYV